MQPPYPIDSRGKRIEPGYHIVYPVRSGSQMWMNEAVVLEFYTVYATYGFGSHEEIKAEVIRENGRFRSKPRKTNLTRFDRLTVVSKD